MLFDLQRIVFADNSIDGLQPGRLSQNEDSLGKTTQNHAFLGKNKSLSEGFSQAPTSTSAYRKRLADDDAQGHLVFASVATACVFVGIHFEQRDLCRCSATNAGAIANGWRCRCRDYSEEKRPGEMAWLSQRIFRPVS